MTDLEVADLLERFADMVLQLPGISRTNPHAFAEVKSELRGEMMCEARELRVTAVFRPPAPRVGTIETGRRQIGSRDIRVERRARRG